MRSRRRDRGIRAENAAADYFVALGFSIIGRNIRFGSLEIDILVCRHDLAVVVEVRTRGEGSFERALESVSERKRKRLREASARAWLQYCEGRAEIRRMRIDVVAVTFSGTETLVEHVEGAIGPEPPACD